MARVPRHPEQDGSAEASGGADKPMTKAEATEAMGRFKGLTRQLLNVSRAQLQTEEERYQREKPKRRRRKR
jgi:hypothetical protein